MIGVREQRETDVREDKILCKEIDQFKEFLGSPSTLMGHINVRVVRLHYTTEENGNNS